MWLCSCVCGNAQTKMTRASALSSTKVTGNDDLEMKQNMKQLSELSCWLAVEVLRVEEASRQFIVGWNSEKIKLFEECWNIMFTECVTDD